MFQNLETHVGGKFKEINLSVGLTHTYGPIRRFEIKIP